MPKGNNWSEKFLKKLISLLYNLPEKEIHNPRIENGKIKFSLYATFRASDWRWFYGSTK